MKITRNGITIMSGTSNTHRKSITIINNETDFSQSIDTGQYGCIDEMLTQFLEGIENIKE